MRVAEQGGARVEARAFDREQVFNGQRVTLRWNWCRAFHRQRRASYLLRRAPFPAASCSKSAPPPGSRLLLEDSAHPTRRTGVISFSAIRSVEGIPPRPSEQANILSCHPERHSGSLGQSVKSLRRCGCDGVKSAQAVWLKAENSDCA